MSESQTNATCLPSYWDPGLATKKTACIQEQSNPNSLMMTHVFSNHLLYHLPCAFTLPSLPIYTSASVVASLSLLRSWDRSTAPKCAQIGFAPPNLGVIYTLIGELQVVEAGFETVDFNHTHSFGFHDRFFYFVASLR